MAAAVRRLAGAEEARIHGRADGVARRRQPPRVDNPDEVDPLRRLRKTLRQHYRTKRRYYGVDYPNFYDRDLRRLFSESPEFADNITAAQFIARIRRPTRRARRRAGPGSTSTRSTRCSRT